MIEEIEHNESCIRDVLSYNRIEVKEIKAIIGPAVSLYKVYVVPGVKISKIKDLAEDFALAIGVTGVRVVTLVDSVGIEVPNRERADVPFKSMLDSKAFLETADELPLIIGYTIDQRIKVIDLVNAPHILVAGATKQGKTMFLKGLYASLKASRNMLNVNVEWIDPKARDADFTKIAETLEMYCAEMDRRFDCFWNADVSDIRNYNRRNADRMPYIVIFIDEYADLSYPKQIWKSVMTSIIRLAQKGRIAGIHLIIATQRPTVDVITGLIKANFPTRVAFRTSSRIDSMTILDVPGAEKLIGNGDMLFSSGVELERVQGAYMSQDEVNAVGEHIGNQYGYQKSSNVPYYLPEQEKPAPQERDKMFEDAARLVVTTQKASVTELQRLLGIGFARASKIMDQLESEKVVSPSQRSVLVNNMSDLEKILNGM